MTAALNRLEDVIEEARPGLHDVGPEGDELPVTWPRSVLAVYTMWNGARFYSETIELFPAAECTEHQGRTEFGRCDGDALYFDSRGRIWREDERIEDAVWDGASLDRWLLGALDAVALMFDGDGEYFEHAFAEDGEVDVAVREQMARAQRKRDYDVPGPAWRLGLELREQGKHAEALKAFEDAVRADATFAWGWLDLALTSEALGRKQEAVDEATAAAEAARPDLRSHFWSHVARLALAAGQADLRAQAARQVETADAQWVPLQIANIEALITDEDMDSARALLAAVAAVAPRNAAVLDLRQRLAAVPRQA